MREQGLERLPLRLQCWDCHQHYRNPQRFAVSSTLIQQQLLLVGAQAALLSSAAEATSKRQPTVTRRSNVHLTASVPVAEASDVDSSTTEPILLRAARGEQVERTPVWMMRQAGRHMAAYRALVAKYPTFRERSEIPEVSLEVSLQPWRAYGVDGVILFSDILTPLPAMGIDFKNAEGLKNFNKNKKLMQPLG